MISCDKCGFGHMTFEEKASCKSWSQMVEERSARKVAVCSECKQATCWYGLFMCDKSQTADVVYLTVGELEKLGLEHPSYWTEEAVLKYTGVR